jgi:hypothetical protein
VRGQDYNSNTQSSFTKRKTGRNSKEESRKQTQKEKQEDESGTTQKDGSGVSGT